MDIYRLSTFFAFVFGIISFAVFYATNTQYNFSSQTTGVMANQQTWFQQVYYTTSAGPGFQILSAFYSIALSLSSCGVAPGEIEPKKDSKRTTSATGVTSEGEDSDSDDTETENSAKVPTPRPTELSASSIAALEFSPIVDPAEVAMATQGALPPPPSTLPTASVV